MIEKEIIVSVNPGICGFGCEVKVKRISKECAEVAIDGSCCGHIQLLAKEMNSLTLRDLFSPITRNPVYLAAQKARCHPSCVIPVAILKAAELAMEMAVPKNVSITIEDQ